jgi:hypothetical protein
MAMTIPHANDKVFTILVLDLAPILSLHLKVIGGLLYFMEDIFSLFY